MISALLPWFAANARDLPWRRTRDPYAIHVSEIMLQQTQVKTVIPFWERWMRELPTIQAAAKARPEKLHKLWEGLGYYTRVRNLQKAAAVIVERHGGKFPESFDEVLALPGIGRYTAGAVCSIAFNQPVPILDGNVIRVLTRIFGIADNPREKPAQAKLWALAEALVRQAERCRGSGATAVPTSTEGRCSALNQSLMELGALVCVPRNPRCPACPVRKLCAARAQDRIGELPNLGERGRATARSFVAFVVRRGGQFLVRQRPAGVVNAHLWEFPNAELDPTGAAAARPAAVATAASQVLGFAPDKMAPLITVKHSITRYRITLEAFRVDGNGTARCGHGGQWKTPAQLRRLAFTAAHGKILARIEINSRLINRENAA